MDVTDIGSTMLDHRVKGMPGGIAPFRLDAIGARGWNVLREDMTLPLAVLKDSALTHNSHWMRDFLVRSHAVIAPHGKTTMAPQLFARQIEDGAWAITLATPQQIQIARDFGFSRIVLANQLVGRQAIRYVLDELKRDPALDFYCLVDSEAGVAQLAEAARAAKVGRPLQVLLEGGMPGGRTGCRDRESGLRVARAVKAAEPFLTLRGVEGFEGIARGATRAEIETTVRGFLDLLIDLARACEAEDLFTPGEIILSAGGSAFYDMVLARFIHAGLSRPTRVVTRSGCYLTHDSVSYRRLFADIVDRTPAAAAGGGLQPALEVWAYVQSRPEPNKVLLTMGKRDISADDPPLPQTWFRPGRAAPENVGPGHVVTGLNDQHCHMTVPADSPLQVGDMVSFGVSHPCLTFDKWQVICVVDDAYNVTSAVRTFF
ncbi:amino acid deaminase [Limobrevibacterium gyesilva]|uniref:Amino acid deaminase n=1 Tax=Limobrevibacterium gyesilva TaxID=2991712 RepID=A0AA41YN23_9PROT|nr:amino acid deaminase [Limobrevibacterium gyesilva]MCW3475372.1 amino acid deaminase [Limobrevibacterium gyesilva]